MALRDEGFELEDVLPLQKPRHARQVAAARSQFAPLAQEGWEIDDNAPEVNRGTASAKRQSQDQEGAALSVRIPICLRLTLGLECDVIHSL
jgi:hypothetical protein